MRESSQSRLPPQALQFSSQSPPLLLLHRHITKYYHDLFSIRSYRRFLSDIKLANCDQVNIYQLTLQILTRSQSANLCYQHGAPNVSCSEIAFIMLRHNQCCIYPAQKQSNRLHLTSRLHFYNVLKNTQTGCFTQHFRLHFYNVLKNTQTGCFTQHAQFLAIRK